MSSKFIFLRNDKKGLTLIEILIAMGIASIVGALLLVIIVNSAELFYKQSSKVGQGVGVNDSLSEIREAIKEAKGIQNSYPPGSSPTYTTGGTELILSVSAIDINNNLILGIYDYYVYFLDGDKLRFKSFPDAQSSRKAANQILSLNVDKLLFQYLNSQNPPQEVSPSLAKKIRITLKLKQKSGGGYETSIATSEANLRND